MDSRQRRGAGPPLHSCAAAKRRRPERLEGVPFTSRCAYGATRGDVTAGAVSPWLGSKRPNFLFFSPLFKKNLHMYPRRYDFKI